MKHAWSEGLRLTEAIENADLGMQHWRDCNHNRISRNIGMYHSLILFVVVTPAALLLLLLLVQVVVAIQ